MYNANIFSKNIMGVHVCIASGICDDDNEF